MKFREVRQGVVCHILLILFLGTSRETRPGDDGFTLRSLLPPGAQHAALRRAVMGARERLARPECQRLFSEFKDASGRTLQENLDAQGQTAASYVDRILFADGARLRRCKDSPNVLAMTDQGSRVVYICGRQFAFVDGNNAAQTEAFIIHEELHSLGLGEDPPSSKEITARVLASCVF
jgi:hypothetical protein